jgi:hypothetical protein
MALEAGEHGLDAVRVDAGQARHRGDEEPPDHLGGAVDVLAGVERLGHRHALAPALGVAGDRAHEQHVPLPLGPERGAERADQRHCDPA